MADDKATLIDAQADVEGTLKGKDAACSGRFRGEVELSGRAGAGRGRAGGRQGGRGRRGVSGEFKGEIRARAVTLGEKARVDGTWTPRSWWFARARGCPARSPPARGRAPPRVGMPRRFRGGGVRVILRELADTAGLRAAGRRRRRGRGRRPIDRRARALTFVANRATLALRPRGRS